MSRRVAPPSGLAPPAIALLAGAPVELRPIAQEICRRYREEFPDEQERYGDAGVAWCIHDNQHIVNWAVGEIEGWVSLEEKLAWLARVLEARDFPLDRLARNLEIAAGVVSEDVQDGRRLGDVLTVGARFVRSRESFLG